MAHSIRSRAGQPLLWVLGGGAVIRLLLIVAVWNHPQRVIAQDSAGYLAPARTLVESGTFAGEARPEIFRTPGYPLLLAASLPLGDHWWRGVLICQLIFELATIAITCMLAGSILGKTGGLWAATFQAVSVVALISSVRILSDCLFTMVFTLSLLLLVRHLESRRFTFLLLAAVAGALATYVRPIGVLLVPAVLFALGLWPGHRRQALLFAVVFLALLSPWVLRNRAVADFNGFSSAAQVNLQMCESAELLAADRGILLLEAQREIEEDFDRRMGLLDPSPSPGEIARRRAGEGLAVIRGRPLEWAWMHLRTSFASLLPAETYLCESLGATRGGRGTLGVLHREGLPAAIDHYFQDERWLILVLVPLLTLTFTVYALIVVAGINRGRRGPGDRGRLLAMVTVMLLFAAGPAAEPRFRTPVSPIMAIAAAAGALSLRRVIDRTPGEAQPLDSE